MDGNELVYKTAGKYWDVEQAKFVEAPHPGKDVVPLQSAEGDNSEAYLIQTLLFYGYPLGELVWKSPEGLRKALAELDDAYLTPRVMAGLATGDAYALEQWQAHEEAAKPLRERLAELTTQ